MASLKGSQLTPRAGNSTQSAGPATPMAPLRKTVKKKQQEIQKKQSHIKPIGGPLYNPSQRKYSNLAVTTLRALHPLLDQMLPQHPVLKTSASLGDRLALVPDDKLPSFKRIRNGYVREVFGTQQPIIRIMGATVAIAATASTIASSTPIDLDGTAGAFDWNSWKAVFDECRIIRAKFHVINEFSPIASSTASSCILNWTIWAVDYDDASALGSVGAALVYDTHREIPLVSTGENFHHVIDVLPEGTPDMTWDTTASTTPIAWVKAVNVNATAANVQYFTVFVEYDVEFRQVD